MCFKYVIKKKIYWGGKPNSFANGFWVLPGKVDDFMKAKLVELNLVWIANFHQVSTGGVWGVITDVRVSLSAKNRALCTLAWSWSLKPLLTTVAQDVSRSFVPIGTDWSWRAIKARPGFNKDISPWRHRTCFRLDFSPFEPLTVRLFNQQFSLEIYKWEHARNIVDNL